MSACRFDFHLPVAEDRLLRRLQADFARFGGTVTPAGQGGAASGFGEFRLPTPLGEFAGTYEITGGASNSCAVRINVDAKPMFVPCGAIEEHLSRRLSRLAEPSGAPFRSA